MKREESREGCKRVRFKERQAARGRKEKRETEAGTHINRSKCKQTNYKADDHIRKTAQA